MSVIGIDFGNNTLRSCVCPCVCVCVFVSAPQLRSTVWRGRVPVTSSLRADSDCLTCAALFSTQNRCKVALPAGGIVEVVLNDVTNRETPLSLKLLDCLSHHTRTNYATCPHVVKHTRLQPPYYAPAMQLSLSQKCGWGECVGVCRQSCLWKDADDVICI